MYLWFPCVLVGLDEDLADADIFADSPESWLHGLPSSQDGHTCNLENEKIITHRGYLHHFRYRQNCPYWSLNKKLYDMAGSKWVHSPSSRENSCLHNPLLGVSALHGPDNIKNHNSVSRMLIAVKTVLQKSGKQFVLSYSKLQSVRLWCVCVIQIWIWCLRYGNFPLW